MIDVIRHVDRASLTGGAPFPALEDWLADGALYSQQALQAIAKTRNLSNDQLLPILKAPRSEWQHALLHPGTYSFIANSGTTPPWSDVLNFQKSGVCEEGPYVWKQSPGTHFESALKKLGKGSRRSHCRDAEFLGTASPHFAKHIANLTGGMRLITELTPGFASELSDLVEWIALVDDGASFRGASGVILRGLVLLSPAQDWTPAVFAEELVHESTHTLLDLISLRDPLLAGADALREEHAAPFRPDKRHLLGNFHALVVVSRLICLFEVFEKNGIEPDQNWAEKAFKYADRSRTALQGVRSYPGLSPIAKHLLDDLVVAVMSNVLQGR